MVRQMCAQQGNLLTTSKCNPVFYKHDSNYVQVEQWRGEKDVKVRDVDKTQNQEVGGTFLSYAGPQLGSDRVRLEPKSPQYLGQRGAPARPLSSISRFPPVLSLQL